MGQGGWGCLRLLPPWGSDLRKVGSWFLASHGVEVAGTCSNRWHTLIISYSNKHTCIKSTILIWCIKKSTHMCHKFTSSWYFFHLFPAEFSKSRDQRLAAGAWYVAPTWDEWLQRVVGQRWGEAETMGNTPIWWKNLEIFIEFYWWSLVEFDCTSLQVLKKTWEREEELQVAVGSCDFAQGCSGLMPSSRSESKRHQSRDLYAARLAAKNYRMPRSSLWFESKAPPVGNRYASTWGVSPWHPPVGKRLSAGKTQQEWVVIENTTNQSNYCVGFQHWGMILVRIVIYWLLLNFLRELRGNCQAWPSQNCLTFIFAKMNLP